MKTNIKINPSILLLIFVLFFPEKNIYLFLAGSLLIVGMIFCKNDFKGYRSFALNVFLIFVFFVFLSSTVGAIYYNVSAFRNYTELFRFIPVILLLFIYKKINIPFRVFCKICIVYVFIDLTVSILEFMGQERIKILVNLYASDIHGETSLANLYASNQYVDPALSIVSRALGLSSGPGQHGTILCMMIAVLLSTFYGTNKNRLVNYIAIICSFISILLSQSRTAFIVSAFIIVFSLMIMLFKSNYKRTAIKFIAIGTLAVFFFLLRYIKRLGYLHGLFTHGFSAHSFTARISKGRDVVERIQDNILFSIFGHGKDYFGGISRAMDNEYLFIFSVYGLIPFLLVILFYLSTVIAVYFNRIHTRYSIILLYMIMCGLILSFPAGFILDVRILYILTLVFIQHKNTLIYENTISCSR